MKNKKFGLVKVIGVLVGICVIGAASITLANQVKREMRINQLKKAEVGDVVKFGKYMFADQEKFETKMYEMNNWIVLDKKDGKLLLFAKSSVDKCNYAKESDKEANWENSNIREWLNGEYFNMAFNKKEQKMIVETKVDNGKDRVFIFTEDEVKSYLPNREDRISEALTDFRGSALRDVNEDSTKFDYMGGNGEIYKGEYDKFEEYPVIGARPVIWVDVSK